MKKIVSILMGASMLFGCTSHQDLITESVSKEPISSVKNINWHDVNVPSSFSIHFSENAQFLTNTAINSPVAGFSFDVADSRVSIEISGIVRDLEVFAPNLSLYDQDFNLLRVYSSKQFDYDRDDFVKGDVLFGKVELNLPLNISKVYGVIYTTEQDLEQVTQLIHPAKAFAIAKRSVPPTVNDIIAEHVDVGEVRVAIKGESVFSGLRSSNNVTQPQMSQVEAQSKVEKAEINAVPETQSYYHNAIKSAVEANNISKALSLLDEAKALNVEGAQEAFVKAVNAK